MRILLLLLVVLTVPAAESQPVILDAAQFAEVQAIRTELANFQSSFQLLIRLTIAGAFACSFLCGMYAFRLMSLGKNQKHIW